MPDISERLPIITKYKQWAPEKGTAKKEMPDFEAFDRALVKALDQLQEAADVQKERNDSFCLGCGNMNFCIWFQDVSMPVNGVHYHCCATLVLLKRQNNEYFDTIYALKTDANQDQFLLIAQSNAKNSRQIYEDHEISEMLSGAINYACEMYKKKNKHRPDFFKKAF